MGAYIGLVPPADASTAITASLSAAGTLLSTPTAGYQSISVQLTGAWESEITFQASNDGINWVNVQGYAFNSTMSAIDTAYDNDIYVFPVIGFYFQVVVSNYVAGTIVVTAYLRTQGLAGLGEASLSQAMDPINGTPVGVTVQQLGQQSSASSIPVTLSNENIQDKFIVGKTFQGAIPINTVLTNDPNTPNVNGWIDCLQYRSVAFHVVQLSSATGGSINFEVSNDGVTSINNPVGFYDTQGVDSSALGPSASSSLSSTGAKTIVRVGNITYRYFRIRVATAVTGTPILQTFVTLRMVPSPFVNIAQGNFSFLGGAQVPVVTTSNPNLALTTSNYTSSYLPVGGTDNSVVNPQLQGAAYPIASTNAAFVPGPFNRRNYVDLTGGQGVAGPDPRYAEDKTYPVNVRLERSINGQDSVQDLLQQLLIEQKAMNYYLRELPTAIAQMLAVPNPGFPTSMQDDPENFASDARSDMNVRGH